MRISDWSSDVCSSDLDFGILAGFMAVGQRHRGLQRRAKLFLRHQVAHAGVDRLVQRVGRQRGAVHLADQVRRHLAGTETRSEEHTSELQSLMRISYAVFCLKKKKHKAQ